jgi:hypothetical protein
METAQFSMLNESGHSPLPLLAHANSCLFPRPRIRRFQNPFFSASPAAYLRGWSAVFFAFFFILLLPFPSANCFDSGTQDL